ncbi:uncharacterized protein B0T23DRAFT_420953 [Neurospora hispaniola]|uniref:STPR domain-containing protein n=1 Tax=Neurospora hispaniola TaxID=588809 RepID=A0AAJ0I573_9PEZI|nr:hypothetical protein B0T23DRAFT_420953 [Neurospora hispaniola]
MSVQWRLSLSAESIRRKKVAPPSASWIELTLIVDNQDADVASWEKEVVAEDEHILKIAFTAAAPPISPAFFSGLTQAEIAAEIQRIRRNEKRAEKIAKETPYEKKKRQFDHNKWRRDSDATETPEACKARLAKQAAWARDHLANETLEHRDARLETMKKRYRERETPEKPTCSVKLRYHLSRVLDSSPPPLFPNVAESQCRLDFKRKARLAYNKEYKKNRLDDETPDEREAT